MRRLLQFFSLTSATQLCLLANQLLLLPLELRVWGPASVAAWFIAIATANLISVADLGLRNAGHETLLSGRNGNMAARNAFRSIWAMTRGLVVGLSIVFFAYNWLSDAPSPTLLAILTASVMLDTLTVLRGIWCDTLGYFNRVEASYCALVASRVALSGLALLLFKASPMAVATILMLTSAGALLTQVALLPVPELSLLAGGFNNLRPSSFFVVRWVLAEPIVGWLRLSFPVIGPAAIAPSPAFITTYVALRAIFGVPRQVIIQLSRYMSVQFANRVCNGTTITNLRDDGSAEHRLVRHSMLAAMLIGTTVACMLLADNGRLLRLWLLSGNVAFESSILLSYGMIAVFSGHQVVVSIMVRCGAIVAVSKRLYAYVIMSVISAGIACFIFGNAPIYLAMLTLQELAIAVLFVSPLGYRLRSAIIAAVTVAVAVVAGVWAIVRLDPGGLFQAEACAAWVSSLLLAGIAVLATAGLFYTIDRLARLPHTVASSSGQRWA